MIFLKKLDILHMANNNLLNLVVLGKDNTVSILLVNATMCLNPIREPNVIHLKNCT